MTHPAQGRRRDSLIGGVLRFTQQRHAIGDIRKPRHKRVRQLVHALTKPLQFSLIHHVLTPSGLPSSAPGGHPWQTALSVRFGAFTFPACFPVTFLVAFAALHVWPTYSIALRFASDHHAAVTAPVWLSLSFVQPLATVTVHCAFLLALVTSGAGDRLAAVEVKLAVAQRRPLRLRVCVIHTQRGALFQNGIISKPHCIKFFFACADRVFNCPRRRFG